MPTTQPAQLTIICAWCGRVKVGLKFVVAPTPEGPISHGLCRRCQYRNFPKRKHVEDTVRRFFASVVIPNQWECWEWVARKNNKGYGVLMVFSRPTYAHRFSYERHYGEIPEGMVIDHICHNPACVNPGHLRACTQADNLHNMGISSHNKSGFKGVCRRTGKPKWRATINVSNKQIYLGGFDTPEEAHVAYCKAAVKYFGEFANFGTDPACEAKTRQEWGLTA